MTAQTHKSGASLLVSRPTDLANFIFILAPVCMQGKSTACFLGLFDASSRWKGVKNAGKEGVVIGIRKECFSDRTKKEDCGAFFSLLLFLFSFRTSSIRERQPKRDREGYLPAASMSSQLHSVGAEILTLFFRSFHVPLFSSSLLLRLDFP